MYHFSAIQEKSRSVSHTSPTKRQDQPLKPALMKTNLISRQPQKQNQNQEKPAVANLLKDLPPPGQTLLSCAHSTLSHGHQLHRHISQEKLPSQQRWMSSRQVSDFFVSTMVSLTVKAFIISSYSICYY